MSMRGLANDNQRQTPRRLRSMLLVIGFMVMTATAYAVQPDEILKDAALESRARALSTGLRCLVCQNQSIDDSDAPLARDLRILVRERLTAGDSDDAVIQYLVARYGDFVLLKPPMRRSTLLLWLMPLLILAGALWAVAANYRSRPDTKTALQQLTADEEAALATALERGRGHHD
jgi:cytochrome c-type biogenesis protein CcmH